MSDEIERADDALNETRAANRQLTKAATRHIALARRIARMDGEAQDAIRGQRD